MKTTWQPKYDTKIRLYCDLLLFEENIFQPFPHATACFLSFSIKIRAHPGVRRCKNLSNSADSDDVSKESERAKRVLNYYQTPARAIETQEKYQVLTPRINLK